MCLLRHVVVAAAELNDEASSLKAHYVRSYLHWAVIEDNEYNSMINVKVFKKFRQQFLKNYINNLL